MNSERKYIQNQNEKTITRNMNNVYKATTLGDSLPPPHPSKFSEKCNFDNSLKNKDLRKSIDESKNNFMTMGKDLR